MAFQVLVALRTRFKAFSLVDCLLVAVVVGLSVLVWRSAGNSGVLNDDPIPPGESQRRAVSPGELSLCGFYTAFRRPVDAVRFEQARVLLTLVSLVVNVVTI